jgi:hypothetical protein
LLEAHDAAAAEVNAGDDFEGHRGSDCNGMRRMREGDGAPDRGLPPAATSSGIRPRCVRRRRTCTDLSACASF